MAASIAADGLPSEAAASCKRPRRVSRRGLSFLRAVTFSRNANGVREVDPAHAVGVAAKRNRLGRREPCLPFFLFLDMLTLMQQTRPVLDSANDALNPAFGYYFDFWYYAPSRRDTGVRLA